jgi:hypothetical protein
VKRFFISFGRVYAYTEGDPSDLYLPAPGDLINTTSRAGEPMNVVIGMNGTVNVEEIDVFDILVVPSSPDCNKLMQVRPHAHGVGILVDLGLGRLPGQSVRCPGKTARPGWITTGDNYRN